MATSNIGSPFQPLPAGGGGDGQLSSAKSKIWKSWESGSPIPMDMSKSMFFRPVEKAREKATSSFTNNGSKRPLPGPEDQLQLLMQLKRPKPLKPPSPEVKPGEPGAELVPAKIKIKLLSPVKLPPPTQQQPAIASASSSLALPTIAVPMAVPAPIFRPVPGPSPVQVPQPTASSQSSPPAQASASVASQDTSQGSSRRPTTTSDRQSDPATTAAAATGKGSGRTMSMESHQAIKIQPKRLPGFKSDGGRFLQKTSCLEIDADSVPLCRDCQVREHRDSVADVSRLRGECRFLEVRMLKASSDSNQNQELRVDGFASETDATEQDTKWWLPGAGQIIGFSWADARFLLFHLAELFCNIVKKEFDFVKDWQELTRIWKKPVKGVRESCDVCWTAIFNCHLVCPECGFVVCIDCFEARFWSLVHGKPPPVNYQLLSQRKTNQKNRYLRALDEFGWLQCTGKLKHQAKELVLAQFIVDSVVKGLNRVLHYDPDSSRYLACKCKREEDNELYDDKVQNANAIADGGGVESKSPKKIDVRFKKFSDDFFEDYEDEVVQQPKPKPTQHSKVTVIRLNRSAISFIYKQVPHQWFFAGKLLVLKDPKLAGNLQLFQCHWATGEPVIVQNVHKHLDYNLWHPKSFNKEFGHRKAKLVDCMTGSELPKEKMATFWNGFEDIDQRVRRDDGTEMLLKLKDWPPHTEFKKLLPKHFQDLMSALPVPEYTTVGGPLNMATRLPDFFVRPDLGPKMYCAYGSVERQDKGTTNLHLDGSDAINVMIYVGDDCQDKDQKQAIEAVKEAGADQAMMDRIQEPGARIGAIWHIYPACDAAKIREFFKMLAKERQVKVKVEKTEDDDETDEGEDVKVKQEASPKKYDNDNDYDDGSSDPIHDQNRYLDDDLRQRLFNEYGVTGYAIGQCLGDAVFIPAGAPHQVRNLSSCIKVAGEFISPENIKRCLILTDEFRRLSDRHQNHEDKLQIKNVVYHSVKDSMAVFYKKPEQHVNNSKC